MGGQVISVSGQLDSAGFRSLKQSAGIAPQEVANAKSLHLIAKCVDYNDFALTSHSAPYKEDFDLLLGGLQRSANGPHFHGQGCWPWPRGKHGVVECPLKATTCCHAETIAQWMCFFYSIAFTKCCLCLTSSNAGY